MTKREGGGTLPQALRAKLGGIVEDMRAGVDPESYDEPEPKPGVEHGRTTSLEEACEILDPYAKHVEAGASDRWLHVQTQIPLTTILRWRRHRGIDRRSYEREHGLARPRLGALDLFRDESGEDFGIQFTAESPVLGQWKPPNIILRQQLDYDRMARYLYFLRKEAPASAAQLATAFGLTVTDVEMAIELYTRRLQEAGKLCPKCGTASEEKYCSARCRRRK